MLTKTKIAMAAALILSNESLALAGDQSGEYTGGGPTQTWQDIEQSRRDIQLLIQKTYPSSNLGKTYGYVAPTKPRRSHQ